MAVVSASEHRYDAPQTTHLTFLSTKSCDHLLQISLSRHVNSHFKPPCVPRGAESPTKTAALHRKTRRKLSLRSNVTSHNTKDLFHVGVMAGVKDGLARLKPPVKGSWKSEEEEERVRFDRTGQAVVLRSKVTSRRLEESGDIHYLISWLPQGM